MSRSPELPVEFGLAGTTPVSQRVDRWAVRGYKEEVQLDRNRLFALLGALEEDLRFIIEAYLLTTRTEEQVLGHAYEKAMERFANDDDSDAAQTNVVDYLDLGDEIEILHRWRSELPAQTRDSLSSSAGRLADLVQIRNRVVHRRPLLVDDFEKAKQVLMQLDRDGFEDPALKEVLRHVQEDPGWAPVSSIPSLGARTLNNLPLGDYDETGLVGRRSELNKLAKRLIDLSTTRRGQVLTVVGPGGVGKTALVLQALHDLVNDEECPYDIVSWVSLKTERLTARGVQSIHDAVLSVEQAVPALIEALEPSFDGTASQLADSLDGLSALIVIDNLETVSGREVLELIDILPETVSYLFTSREGLGEVERRFSLGPLEEKSAVDLLRRLARARDLEPFVQMTQLAAKELVHELGASPLGLKWFVASVEIGKDPKELVRHREDLVQFCVANVFGSLDSDAKKVGGVLHVLARPVTVQEIRLFLPDMSSDSLRAAVKALDRRMFIRKDFVADSIAETFEATEPLSDYLRYANVVDADEERRLREADAVYRSEEERHRLDAASDALRPNVIQGGQEHRASVLLLRDALSKSKGGKVNEALDRIREAEGLDPEFWEIHRVRGFILSSNGQTDQATTSYLRAIEFAPTNKESAAVKYYFAGHLSRKARDPEKAVTVAQEAHDALGSPKTAIELGRAMTYVGEFDSAEETLKEAIDSEDTRTRLIAITQLIECMKRRAEAESAVDRQPDKAIATLDSAIDFANIAVKQDLVDARLTEKVVALASELLITANNCRNEQATQIALTKALQLVEQLGRAAVRSNSYGYLVGHARRLITQRPTFATQVPLITSYAGNDIDDSQNSMPSKNVDEYALVGSVTTWKPDRHFGFIRAHDSEQDFYFHRATLAYSGDEILLRQDLVVRFNRSSESEGKSPAARDVRVDEFDSNALLHRRIVVDRNHNSGNCVFSTDLNSGATVFVGRNAMISDSEWDKIEIGSFLESAVEIDEQGRFRASTRSTRICG